MTPKQQADDAITVLSSKASSAEGTATVVNVPDEPQAEKCEECEGAGVIYEDEWGQSIAPKPCRVCHGTGKKGPV